MLFFSSEKEEEGSVGWYWVLFALRINPTLTLNIKKNCVINHFIYVKLGYGYDFFSELCFSKILISNKLFDLLNFSNLQEMPRAFDQSRCQ